MRIAKSRLLVVFLSLAVVGVAAGSFAAARTLLRAKPAIAFTVVGTTNAPSPSPSVQDGVSAPSSAAFTYPNEGVDLRALQDAAPLSLTASEVLTEFKAQAVPEDFLGEQLDRISPTISTNSVVETSPISSAVEAGVAYAAYVVTYAGTTPVSFGPRAVKAMPGATCDFVGILEAATNSWTEFFQDCH